MLYCKSCGASVREGAKFCTSCGAPITAPEAPAAPQEPAYSQEQVYSPPPAYPQEPPYSPPPSYPQGPAYQRQSYQDDGYQRGPSRQHQMVYRQPEPRYRAQAPLGGITIGGIFNRAMGILRTKPLRLWGLSLMFGLLEFLAVATCFLLPIVYVPIIFALMVGMKAIYLDGIRGREITSDQLFAGFKNFFRSAGGIAWMELWVLIWGLVPIAGFVLAIIKSYSYRFVPYIMVEDPEISATAALRRSKELTYGMKGKMFGADILIVAVVFAVDLLLSLLSLIPYVGVLFMLVGGVFSLLVYVLLPLFVGLVEAAFYDECPRK